ECVSSPPQPPIEGKKRIRSPGGSPGQHPRGGRGWLERLYPYALLSDDLVTDRDGRDKGGNFLGTPPSADRPDRPLSSYGLGRNKGGKSGEFIPVAPAYRDGRDKGGLLIVREFRVVVSGPGEGERIATNRQFPPADGVLIDVGAGLGAHVVEGLGL